MTALVRWAFIKTVWATAACAFTLGVWSNAPRFY